MKYLVGPLALVLLLMLLDRLRQIRWPVSPILRALGRKPKRCGRDEARPLYVAMYLFKSSFALGVLGVAIFLDEAWWRLGLAGIGVAGILCWAINTRRQWGKGPPPQVLSQAAEFDDRPIRRDRPDRRNGKRPPPDGRERRVED